MEEHADIAWAGATGLSTGPHSSESRNKFISQKENSIDFFAEINNQSCLGSLDEHASDSTGFSQFCQKAEGRFPELVKHNDHSLLELVNKREELAQKQKREESSHSHSILSKLETIETPNIKPGQYNQKVVTGEGIVTKLTQRPKNKQRLGNAHVLDSNHNGLLNRSNYLSKSPKTSCLAVQSRHNQIEESELLSETSLKTTLKPSSFKPTYYKSKGFFLNHKETEENLLQIATYRNINIENFPSNQPRIDPTELEFLKFSSPYNEFCLMLETEENASLGSNPCNSDWEIKLIQILMNWPKCQMNMIVSRQIGTINNNNNNQSLDPYMFRNTCISKIIQHLPELMTKSNYWLLNLSRLIDKFWSFIFSTNLTNMNQCFVRVQIQVPKNYTTRSNNYSIVQILLLDYHAVISSIEIYKGKTAKTKKKHDFAVTRQLKINIISHQVAEVKVLDQIMNPVEDADAGNQIQSQSRKSRLKWQVPPREYLCMLAKTKSTLHYFLKFKRLSLVR